MHSILLPSIALMLGAIGACGRVSRDTDRHDGREPTAAQSTAALVLPSASIVTTSRHAMGTLVTIKVHTDREMAARAAMLDATREIDRLDAMMTTWREDSELARVNRAAGTQEKVPVSPELFDVLRAARTIHDESSGVFDVTFQALKGLWHFDQDLSERVPSEAEIAARLPLVDGRAVELDPQQHTVRLPRAGMAINLGGIAKGYAVDRAAAVLERHGFRDLIVQAGGDLLVRGHKGDRPWTVGVRDPRGPEGDFFALVDIEDAAFSTAGDYERAFVKNGVRYHHILDPRTGRPAMACRSVTILAPDALTADQLDDAVFILGPEKGLALIEGKPSVGAVIVDRSNRIHVSRNLADRFHVVHPPTDAP